MFLSTFDKKVKYFEYLHLLKQVGILASAESDIFKPLELALMQQTHVSRATTANDFEEAAFTFNIRRYI